MQRRYVTLGLAAILAIALAVPALGGPSNPVSKAAASVKTTAEKALKKAKKASKQAKAAQATANAAQSDANAAQSTANGAKTAADAAQSTANGAKTAADNAQASADAAAAAAAAAQATANSKFGTMDRVEGTASPEDSDSPKLVAAICNAGDVTGGGWAINGAGANDVTVTLNSEFYDGQWVVQAQEIGGGTNQNWSIGANAECIS